MSVDPAAPVIAPEEEPLPDAELEDGAGTDGTDPANPEAAPMEKPKAKGKTAAPAASIAQLREIAPDDPEFVLSALEKNMTREDAAVALIAKMRTTKVTAPASSATARSMGRTPVTSVPPVSTPGQPRSYAEAVRQVFANHRIPTKAGGSRSLNRASAVDFGIACYAAKEQYPDLHAQWAREKYPAIQL